MLAATVFVLTGVLSAAAGTVGVEPVSPTTGETFRVFAEAGPDETLNCTLTVVTPSAMESLSCRAPTLLATAPGSYRVVARFSHPEGERQAEVRFDVTGRPVDGTERPKASPPTTAGVSSPQPLVEVPRGERVLTPVPKRPGVLRRRRRRRAAAPPSPAVDLSVVGTPLVGGTVTLVLRGDLAEGAPTGLVVQSPEGETTLTGPGPFQVMLRQPGPWSFVAVQGSTTLDRADLVVPAPTLTLTAPQTVPLGEMARVTATVDNASPAIDWSYSVVLSAPSGDQTVLTRQGGGWSFAVTDAGPWMVAALASAAGGLLEVAAQEVTGGALSLLVSPQHPQAGSSSLVEVFDSPLVGELELQVSSPEGGTEVLDGSGPWTVEWSVAGTWTLLLRSTHEGRSHEATTAVVVGATSLAQLPSAEAPDDGAPDDGAPDDAAPPPTPEAPPEAVSEQVPAEEGPAQPLLGLFLVAALGLSGAVTWHWVRRPRLAKPVDVRGVQLQRGPTRVRSTGASLRSLRVSLVVDRGPTRVSLRSTPTEDAS